MKVREKNVTCGRLGPLKAPPSGERAFTLIEMLVVIATMALLTMLLIPSLGGIFGVERTTRCANNLKRIAEGVNLRVAAGQDHVHPMAWQEMVREYIGGESSCFVCPEISRTKQEDALARPLKDLVQFKVVKGSRQCFQEVDKGPYVIRLSGEQYHKAKADNMFQNAYVQRSQYPRAKYEDGSENDANPYWLCLQDCW
jgi:prepilin-type N-terminal cleavage/methylation domain-containing protein